jgi:acetate kinase
VILVLNCGSSSIKFRLFDTDLQARSGGLVERIGEPGGPESFEAALGTVISGLKLDSDRLTAIGHRVVHGGSSFAAPTVIDEDVIATVERLTPLAPLHNPPALAAIRACRRRRPDVPQVAVFDTAFHSTLPPRAYTYAIDTDVAAALGIRRYGFHGTSHEYVSRRTAEFLGRSPAATNTIVLHLGNGASICAVAGGRSVETSMGLTPLEGLVMGNRGGDIDPGVLLHLHRVGGYRFDDIDALLNRRSGLFGIAGDNDMRAIQQRRAAGDEAATLAFDTYCHRLRKYVGAYTAVLGRVDAITFTGGVGENSAEVRAAVLSGLDGFGIEMDPDRNDRAAGADTLISTDRSRVAVTVIPTDEELEIATQTQRVVRTAGGHQPSI